jgi:hypothetical protein
VGGQSTLGDPAGRRAIHRSPPMARAEPEGTLTPAARTSSAGDWCEWWRPMLFIGYELDAQGQIELVAPINAVEEPGRRKAHPGSPGAGLSSTTGTSAASACRPTSSTRCTRAATRAAPNHGGADHPGRPDPPANDPGAALEGASMPRAVATPAQAET